MCIRDRRGTQSNRFGVGATVRLESAAGPQVRQLVLARGYLSSSEPILHFGLGEDTRIKRLTVDWPSGQTQTFVDLPVDRRLTITEPSASAARPAPAGQFSEVSEATGLSWLASEAVRQEARPQPLVPTRFSRRGPALAVGDLDGDGRDDVLVGGTSAAPARVFLAGASARFTAVEAPGLATRALVEDGPALLSLI